MLDRDSPNLNGRHVFYETILMLDQITMEKKKGAGGVKFVMQEYVHVVKNLRQLYNVPLLVHNTVTLIIIFNITNYNDISISQ